MLKLKLILQPPDAKSRFIRKDPDAGKDWRQEKKGTTEDEMVGWHHWLNGHKFEQAPGVSDGQGDLALCSLWGRKVLDTTERLNWTDLTWKFLAKTLKDAWGLLLRNRQVCARRDKSQYKWKLWFHLVPQAHIDTAAAAKSLQSCLTLCDPIDGSLSGSPVPGILQARTLEWVAISFSNAWKWKVKVKSLSRVWLLVTPWTAAYQAPPSMGFSRQEYWSGVPLWSS